VNKSIKFSECRKFFFFINFLIFFFFFPFLSTKAFAENLEITGKKLFFNNCITCHSGGQNIIIPEKNLKKESLEANGMNTISAITYQILNGKNGMPAFGGRLTEMEIEEIANFVFQESLTNFSQYSFNIEKKSQY
jgi:cytochrome c6